MKAALLIISLFIGLTILSQTDKHDSEVYEVVTISQFNSGIESMVSYADNQIAFCQSPIITDYVSNWHPKASNSLTNTKLNYEDFYFKNITSSIPDIPLSTNETIGTISYSSKDSSYAYCSLKNGSYSIHYLKNGIRKTVLKGAKGEHYIHPFITKDGTRIFFSSNQGRKTKDYNIYFINKIEDDWSIPVKLHPDINSRNNEVFPTWYEDTLYYSSNASGHLDLYFSPKSSQYSSSYKLDAPFNSNKDDFFLHKLNSNVSILTSDRGPDFNKPLLIKKKLKNNEEKTYMRGFIACAGNRISNIPLKLTSVWGEELDSTISDSEGNFIFQTNKSLKKFRIKLDKSDPRTRDCATIYLTDENGNVIQKIILNDEGNFQFELLDTDKIANLNLIPLEDESLLKVNIDGQIFQETPGDVGQGKAIKIIDEDNNLLAMAYTEADGSFKFKDLSPDKEYNFNFDEIKKQIQLLIYKNGEVIIVPVNGSKATYQRIEEENAIELLDENGLSITIEASESFEISNILYEFGSSELTEKAKFQLDKLAQLIFNNDKIIIELTSHTDSRGLAEFNLKLSQNRVNAAIDYLINTGVKKEQLQGYGMGEKNLINNCADGIECSEEEHALNRRTEIRIISP